VSARQTAVIVAVPEAAPVVDGWREQTCGGTSSRGVPAHVTLLYPFVPADELGAATVAQLAALFAAAAPFDAAFREVRRWPELAYLAPDPPEPFVALTEAIVARWPAQPPYAGETAEIVPHLTCAMGASELLDRVEADIRPRLPIAARVTEALLIEEVEPGANLWRTRERFRLGAGERP
jgi:hypothetical protein